MRGTSGPPAPVVAEIASRRRSWPELRSAPRTRTTLRPSSRAIWASGRQPGSSARSTRTQSGRFASSTSSSSDPSPSIRAAWIPSRSTLPSSCSTRPVAVSSGCKVSRGGSTIAASTIVAVRLIAALSPLALSVAMAVIVRSIRPERSGGGSSSTSAREARGVTSRRLAVPDGTWPGSGSRARGSRSPELRRRITRIPAGSPDSR